MNPCVAFTTQRNFFASSPLLFLLSFDLSFALSAPSSPLPLSFSCQSSRPRLPRLCLRLTHVCGYGHSFPHTHLHTHTHIHIRAPRSIWLGHFFCYCAGNASLSSSNLLCVVCGSPQEGVASLCAGRGGRQLRNILISSSGFCERHFRRKKIETTKRKTPEMGMSKRKVAAKNLAGKSSRVIKLLVVAVCHSGNYIFLC